MKRIATVLVLLVGLIGTTGCEHTTPVRTEAQALVDRSRWTLESFLQRPDKPWDLLRSLLPEAQGVVIFPSVLKGAFFAGAEGGTGVMVARDPSGGWGYPAFYTMGGGSIGLQIGGQASEVVLVLRTPGGMRAVVEHQGKLGADVEVTVGFVGAGVEGATTTNLKADIVAFSSAAGLFGGVSMEGTALIARRDYNEAYYEPGATPHGIVLERRYSNPDADLLRRSLGWQR